MGVDLESIMSKPIRALSVVFSFVNLPSALVGKTWFVFAAYQSLSLYIYLSMYYMVSRPVSVHFYIGRVV